MVACNLTSWLFGHSLLKVAMHVLIMGWSEKHICCCEAKERDISADGSLVTSFVPDPTQLLVASSTGAGEVLALLTACAYGTADSDKSCCHPWLVCQDKTLNQ